METDSAAYQYVDVIMFAEIDPLATSFLLLVAMDACGRKSEKPHQGFLVGLFN